jgi:hypothetical protein
MHALMETLAATGSGLLARAMRRAFVWAASLLLCLALLATSFAFLTLGAYRALAEVIGSIHAPLAIGGGYLVFALIGLLIIQSRR